MHQVPFTAYSTETVLLAVPVYPLQKRKVVIDALAEILQVKLDGTDAILPDALKTIQSCSDQGKDITSRC